MWTEYEIKGELKAYKMSGLFDVHLSKKLVNLEAITLLVLLSNINYMKKIMKKIILLFVFLCGFGIGRLHFEQRGNWFFIMRDLEECYRLDLIMNFVLVFVTKMI